LAPTTHTFLDVTAKQAKTPEARFGNNDFKPIQAEFGQTAQAAGDYMTRPEVKAAPAPMQGRANRRCKRVDAADTDEPVRSRQLVLPEPFALAHPEVIAP
jgi:hypothetical protein